VQIGAGLAQEQDWTTQFSPANALECAKPGWFIATIQQPNMVAPGTVPPLDSDGWPTSAEGLLTGQCIAFYTYCGFPVGTAPAGNYTLTWDGEGSVLVYSLHQGVSAVYTVSGSVVPVPVLTNGLIVGIVTSTAGNYVKNIRLIVPGAAATDLFNPTFLALASQFQIVRFNGYQATNSNTQNVGVTRAELPTQTAVTQFTPFGPSMGRIGQLAGALNTSVWVTVPVGADAAYVEALAQVLSAHVHPPNLVYVEIGLECWNSGYADQYQYICNYDQAGNFPGGFPGWDGYDQATAALATINWNIMLPYFKQGNMVRVATNQFGFSSRLLTMCEYLIANAAPGDANHGFDVASGAPYVTANTTGFTAATQPSDIQAEWASVMAGELATEIVEWNATVAQISALAGRQVQTICYEIGFGITAANTSVPWYAAMIACQSDPGMLPLTTAYLTQLAAAGFRGAIWSALVDTPGVSGEWGAVSYTGQPLAQCPKLAALQQYLAG
jgi:hypothetical protein